MYLRTIILFIDGYISVAHYFVLTNGGVNVLLPGCTLLTFEFHSCRFVWPSNSQQLLHTICFMI